MYKYKIQKNLRKIKWVLTENNFAVLVGGKNIFLEKWKMKHYHHFIYGNITTTTTTTNPYVVPNHTWFVVAAMEVMLP